MEKRAAHSEMMSLIYLVIAIALCIGDRPFGALALVFCSGVCSIRAALFSVAAQR